MTIPIEVRDKLRTEYRDGTRKPIGYALPCPYCGKSTTVFEGGAGWYCYRCDRAFERNVNPVFAFHNIVEDGMREGLKKAMLSEIDLLLSDEQALILKANDFETVIRNSISFWGTDFFADTMKEYEQCIFSLNSLKSVYPMSRVIDLMEESAKIEDCLPYVTDEEFDTFSAIKQLLGVLMEDLK
jgi:hypothetical protein